jgi:hypothetical protein
MTGLKMVAAVGVALALVFSYVSTAAADAGSHGPDNSCCHGDE